MKLFIPFFFAAVLFFTGHKLEQPTNARLIDQMGIVINPGENREFAYTDKESAYFYGRTHSIGSDYFSGWNVNTERIFQDYQLLVDGQAIERKYAYVTVYPQLLKRVY